MSSQYINTKEKLIDRRIAIVFFLLIIFLCGFTFYNSVAGAEAEVVSQWNNLKSQIISRSEMTRKLSTILETAKFSNKIVIKELNDSTDAIIKAEKLKELREANFRLENAVNSAFYFVDNDNKHIKENADFINLEKDFKTIAEEIEVARKQYNDAVQSNNTKVKFLPYCLIAEYLNMTEKEYFRPIEKSKHISNKLYGIEKPELYTGEKPKEE